MRKIPILHTAFLCDYTEELCTHVSDEDTANFLWKQEHNLLHASTNSSNWLEKSSPPCLYNSVGCRNHRKAIYGSCTVSSGMSAFVVTGKGVQSSAGMEEEIWWNSVPQRVPRHSPTHAQGSCSTLFSPGHVPPGCAARCCETFTGLIQS